MKLYLQLIEGFPDSQFVGEARERVDRLTRQAMLSGSQPEAAKTGNRR
jgi:hypothetical protein